MESQFDLVTADGKIFSIEHDTPSKAVATVIISKVSPTFVGYKIDQSQLQFNFKSTLAQLGLNGIALSFDLDPSSSIAHVLVQIEAFCPLARALLPLLTPGAYIGKLFARDERRRVRDPDYLLRMFGRFDRKGRPLLSFGGLEKGNRLILEKIEGRTVALLPFCEGVLLYDEKTAGIIPMIAKALHHPSINTRALLPLHQYLKVDSLRQVSNDHMLLAHTLPLHVRTVFGRVVEELLPKGVHHTSASILYPDTQESGNIYELYGTSSEELDHIPLEFYTLEPQREHIFFSDRDQLQDCLEDPSVLFKAFSTLPKPLHGAAFIAKGEQLLSLTAVNWSSRKPKLEPLPGIQNPNQQATAVKKYIEQQPSFPILKAIEEESITSEGILLTRYFPSPLMKQMLLGSHVQQYLKRIYFQYPSATHGNFFSQEDRSLLIDLAKFGITTYWVDEITQKILQYVPRLDKDFGMFTPLDKVETFLKATFFGIYGSNLIKFDFESELFQLLHGVLNLSSKMKHPLLNPSTPIALITGGGPGMMEVGNRVARSLGILSCANAVDFLGNRMGVINEQKENPYIDAKMTYRLDKLIERQSEFYLDFPIFLMGGIGTDFEYALETVRRKVGSVTASPVLLFGSSDYWRRKISSCFQCNSETGTIAGSEWISNCFYVIESGAQGVEIYRQYFSGTLKIGAEGPIFKDGFKIYEKYQADHCL